MKVAEKCPNAKFDKSQPLSCPLLLGSKKCRGNADAQGVVKCHGLTFKVAKGVRNIVMAQKGTMGTGSLAFVSQKAGKRLPGCAADARAKVSCKVAANQGVIDLTQCKTY